MFETKYLRKIKKSRFKKLFKKLGGVINEDFFIDKNYIMQYMIGSHCSAEYINYQIEFVLDNKDLEINYILLNDYEATGLSFDYTEICDLTNEFQEYMKDLFGEKYINDLKRYNKKKSIK